MKLERILEALLLILVLVGLICLALILRSLPEAVSRVVGDLL